jgi:microcystin-dependent protein
MAPFNPSPNIIFNQPIPNNPFYSAETWDFRTPNGPLVFGSGFLVNAATGVVQNAPGAIPPGTVTSITAGTGIATTPSGGITTTGSVALDPVGGALVPGFYTYASVNIDTYGRVISATNGITPVQTVTGTAPIVVTGSAPSVTVSITAATTTAQGSVQLCDNLITPASDLALTALQGYILNQSVSAIAATAGNQFLAGSFNATTAQMVTVTAAGTAKGFVAGSNIPSAATASSGAYVIVTTAGSYNPPGGSGPYAMVPGDQILSDGTKWYWIACGFRPTYATTSVPGIVQLATPADVTPLSNNTLAVTPFSLSTMIASTTQKGFAELATDAETLALASTSVVVTPSNLNALQASTAQRGIVQLSDDINSTATTQAATANAVKQVNDLIIPKTIITANGDLIVGQAAGVPAILPKGTNGSILTVDPTKPLGLDWNVPDSVNSVPVGCINWFTSNVSANLPVGWIICDGSAYSSLAELAPGVPNPYYDLFDVIGTVFGTGGANTFKVPDLRGMFIRGLNDAGGTPAAYDPGRVFASVQTSAVQTHTHPIQSLTHNHGINTVDPGHNHAAASATVVGGNPGWYPGNNNFGTTTPVGGLFDNGSAYTGITASSVDSLVGPDGTYNTLVNTAPTPTNESRPVNIALLPIIKYSYLYG